MPRVTLLLLAAVGVSVAFVQASNAGVSPGFSWVAVTHGESGGRTWVLRAIDSGDGRYCVKVSVKASPRAKRCGRFYVPGPSGAPVELGWASGNDGPQPTFVVGAVTQAARRVTIVLSDGTSRTVPALPPRVDGLAPGISFFVEAKPCTAYPLAITAVDGSGKILVRWRRAGGARPPAHC
jgi:hypothetical protein